MGGLVGGVSSKIVLVAATLTFTARVDREHVRAMLAPQAAVSAVSARLSQKVRLPGDGDATARRRARDRIDIGIGAEEMHVDAKIVSDATLPKDVDLRIGRDMLDHMIDVDLKRHRIRLLLRSEAAGATRGRTAIALTPRADGRWTMPATVAGIAGETAILDFASTAEVQVPAAAADLARIADGAKVAVTLGAARPIDLRVQRDAGAEALPVVGWQTFAGRDVLLDLGHDRIWLEGAAGKTARSGS